MNKKTLAIILSIALAIGAFAGLSFNLFSANAVEYVGDGTEYVVNGDASAAMTLKGSGQSTTGGATKTIVDGPDHGGNNKYLKLTPRTDGNNSSRLHFNSTQYMVEDGGAGKYIASVWVKIPDATTPVEIGFGFDVAYALGVRPTFAVGNEWTNLVVVADLPETSVTQKYILEIVEIGNTKNLDIYIDDFSVQKAVAAATPEPTPTATPEPVFVGDGTNVAYNATGANTNSASVFGKAITACFLQGTTEKKGENISGLRATGAGQDGDGYYAKPDTSSHWTASGDAWRNLVVFYSGHFGTTEVGSKYYVSAYVRLQAAATDVKAYFSTADLSGRLHATSRSQKGEEVTLSTEWTKVEWVVENKDAAKDVFIGLVLTKAASVDFDNISIQKAVDASTLVTPVPTEPATPTTTSTAVPTTVPTAVPTATPEYVGDGKEYVNNGNCYAEMNLKASGHTLSGGATKTIVEAADHGGNNKYYKLTPRTDGVAPGSRFHFNNTANMVNDGGAGMYIASVWVRIPDATTPVKLGFGFGEGFAFGTRPTFEVGSEWTQMVHVMELKDTTAQPKYIIGIFELGETKTLDIHIDDFSVQKAVIKTVGPTPEPTPLPTGNGVEYVINGDLAGEMSLNEETLYVAGGATRIIVPGEDHGGNNRMLKITPRTDGVFGSRLHFNSTNKMVADGGAGQYIASVWVKIPDATEPVNIGFGFAETFTASRPTFKVGNEWTQLVHVMELKDVSEIEKYILGIFEVGATTELDIYVDDFSVQKVGKPQGGSSAGGSNTGDVLPVPLIAVAVISASALVIVARRKREE